MISRRKLFGSIVAVAAIATVNPKALLAESSKEATDLSTSNLYRIISTYEFRTVEPHKEHSLTTARPVLATTHDAALKLAHDAAPERYLDTNHAGEPLDGSIPANNHLCRVRQENITVALIKSNATEQDVLDEWTRIEKAGKRQRDMNKVGWVWS
jgi:hypothetical protein